MPPVEVVTRPAIQALRRRYAMAYRADRARGNGSSESSIPSTSLAGSKRSRALGRRAVRSPGGYSDDAQLDLRPFFEPRQRAVGDRVAFASELNEKAEPSGAPGESLRKLVEEETLRSAGRLIGIQVLFARFRADSVRDVAAVPSRLVKRKALTP